jgi:hypothetical protein
MYQSEHLFHSFINKTISMNKIIIVISILVCQISKAQEITYRLDSNQVISILTSTSPLQLEPLFCSVSAGSLIPKDTVTPNLYVLSFFYNTPKEITLDTTDIVEIRFSNGAIFSFNYGRNDNKLIEKDSSASFVTSVSYECLEKMTKVPVSEIIFVTSLYEHRIEIEERMKLNLPNLAKFLLDKVEAEYKIILTNERRLNVPAIVFDSRANHELDKKYFGKYSGEWYGEEFLYNFDLYIKSDTSYVVWYMLKDPYESDPKRIKTQLLNIRTITENNTLIMDVCYDEDKSDYTNGRRTYYLKLSEDGKTIYGSSLELETHWGEMFGKRKKKYRK